MQDKVLMFLGLSRKAGKLSLGFDAVSQALTKKVSRLVLFSQDASKNTSKKIERLAKNSGIKVLVCKQSKEDFYMLFKRQCAVLSVNDENFANKIFALIREDIYDQSKI